MSVARLSPELKAKLAPLLRLQSSSNDYERANASAAISRLLKNNGADWHDLVEVLLAEAPPVAPEPQPEPGGSSWKRSDGPIDLPRKQLIDLLDLIEQRSDVPADQVRRLHLFAAHATRFGRRSTFRKTVALVAGSGREHRSLDHGR